MVFYIIIDTAPQRDIITNYRQKIIHNNNRGVAHEKKEEDF